MKPIPMPRPTTLEINPVLLKEIRGRMRGARAFLLLTGNLLALSFFTGLFYLAQSPMGGPFGPTPAEVGWNLFVSIALMQFLIVFFGVPTIAANAISAEYENQTYEMLLTTPLSARSIVLGKLLAILAYVTMLILSALPLYSLIYVLGGFRWIDVVRVSAGLLAIAAVYSIMTLFNSAWLRRTVRASGMSFFMSIAWTFLPYVFAILDGILAQGNPIWGWFVMSPLAFYLSILAVNDNSALHSIAGQSPRGTPTWQLSIFLLIGLFFVFSILTMRMVLPEARRPPRSRTFVAIILVLIALLVIGALVHPPSVWRAVFERPLL
nr:ABC transporter permease subunit [Ardenticatena sp.]